MSFFRYDKIYNCIVCSKFTMIDEIMYLNLPDYLTNLEKKGYNRELLEEIAIKAGGKYVSVNESEKKRNVAKHLGWMAGCATITGLSAYFFTEMFLNDYSYVGEATGIFAAIGAMVCLMLIELLVKMLMIKLRLELTII